jgi:hypothetical protein
MIMPQPVITGLLWFSAIGCGLLAGSCGFHMAQGGNSASFEHGFETLARLRGFADFTIFWMAKHLICKGWCLPFWPKPAVVKTYPIPKRG